jgi:hypothetical protein
VGGGGASERECERWQLRGGDALINLLHKIICFDSAVDRKRFVQRFRYRWIIVSGYNGCDTDRDQRDCA